MSSQSDNDGITRCPVAKNNSSATSWNPFNWICNENEARDENKTMSANPSATSCPARQGSSLPPSLEESAGHAQKPHFDQRIPLSTHRVISSIPRGEEKESTNAPFHQPSGEDKWVYPSEQQFYNAMRRKGWEADETTIPTVVRIHNAVNERGWFEVRKWERELHDNPNPKLVRFIGRPNDTSPKAWINTNLLFYNPPFDRHDWFIDRGDGQEPRRYVIDFYNGDDGSYDRGGGILDTVREKFSTQEEHPERSTMPPRPPSLYLDVRPALDDSAALKDRTHMFFREAFPGIFGALDGFKQPVSHTSSRGSTSKPDSSQKQSSTESS